MANDTSSRRREEFRALPEGCSLRDDGQSMPTLVGTLAVFNEWTEINSKAEGHFLERIAPTAFNRTINNNRDQMRVLFQHGRDPQIGDKPLGPIADVYTDEREAHYVVPLLDTSYNRDVAALLAADPPVLGSSFRFEALDEDVVQRPGKSEHNPRGLRERTVKEVRMMEFGPVTFPAYGGTKAGLRSLTDRMTGLLESRMDVEDLDLLAQMIQLAAAYIAEQDEEDDLPNVPKMEAIIGSLAELVPVEVDEQNEPPDDEMLSSEDLDGAEGADEGAAPPDERPGRSFDHPIRIGAREPDPLYTGKKEAPSWRL